MSNTPETEVVRYRIEGMVAFPPNLALTPKELQADLTLFLNGTYDGNALISVAKDPDPTGFALYKVEEVEGLRAQLKSYEDLTSTFKNTSELADRNYNDLAEELAQERERLKCWKEDYKRLVEIFEAKNQVIVKQSVKIMTLEKKIELLETTWWKRFIKWCKGLWKKN